MTLYIFDKDWTLVKPKQGKFINRVEDQIPLPGVIEKCWGLRPQGHKLAIASNQGGVAFGYMTFNEAWTIVNAATALVGADICLMCPYHPNGTVPAYSQDSWNRKPGPGMLFEAAYQTGYFDRPNWWQEIIMVGDMQTDKIAAGNIGAKFIWARDFFGFPDDYKDVE